MKTYEVSFTETYTYTKILTCQDGEDIDDIIHECPTIANMTQEEYNKLQPQLYTEYTTIERSN